MADRNSETKSLNYPPELIGTKLHRLVIERNLQPDEAPSGKLKISLKSSAFRSGDSDNELICELTIMAHGESPETEERAFTAECTMVGVFGVSWVSGPVDDLHDDEVMMLANYLAPTVAETIEAQIYRTGFGSIKIPRSFDAGALESE